MKDRITIRITKKFEDLTFEKIKSLAEERQVSINFLILKLIKREIKRNERRRSVS